MKKIFILTLTAVAASVVASCCCQEQGPPPFTPLPKFTDQIQPAQKIDEIQSQK